MLRLENFLWLQKELVQVRAAVLPSADELPFWLQPYLTP
jgi:hypothetical protein